MISIKDENYSVGELVFKTPSYYATYPNWQVDKGVVISSKVRFIDEKLLSESSKIIYRNRYGKHTEYPIYEMIISTSGGDFLVSQFGFNKDNC